MLLGRRPLGTVAYMGGVPAVLEQFCWSWSQMVSFNCEALDTNTDYVHYNRVTYSDHAPARNKLAADMLGNWILMLDTDHQFDPDILARILRLAETTGAEVISGLYRFKMPPYSAVAYAAEGDSQQPIMSWSDDVDLIEVSATGGGCLWFTRNVYNQLMDKYNCGPFDRFPGVSEDHSFYKRCRELEIKTYLAPHIEAQHLRIVPVTQADCDDTFLDTKPLQVGGFSNG